MADEEKEGRIHRLLSEKVSSGVSLSTKEQKIFDLLEEKRGAVGGAPDVPEARDPFSGAISFLSKDLPDAIGGGFGRTQDRAARIEAPTVLGEKAVDLTGATGFGADVVEGVAGIPERLARTTLGAFGTLSEPAGVAVESGVKLVNRLTGRLGQDLIGAGLEMLGEQEWVQTVAEKVAGWWDGLSESDQANFGTLPDAIDAMGFKTVGDVPVGKGAQALRKTVKIGDDVIPMPTGSASAQRIISKSAGGRKAKENFAESVKESVMKEVNNIRGTKQTFEEVAEQATEGAAKNLKKFNTEFDKAFKGISKAGTEGMKGGGFAGGEPTLLADSWAETLRSSVNRKGRVFDGVKRGAELGTVEVTGPTGITKRTRSFIKEYVDNINNLDKATESKRYNIFRAEKSQLGDMAFKNPNISSQDREVLQALYRKSVDLERDFIANQSSYWGADSKAVLELFDKTNAFYGDTKAIRDFTKKTIGMSADAGETTAKNAQSALNTLLQKNKSDELVKLMDLLDNDAKGHLQNGLLVKMIDNALIEEKGFISLTKLEKFISNYGENALTKVIGKEKVSQVNKLMDAMRTTDANKLKFIDPTNPSGSAASFLESWFPRLESGLGIGAVATAATSPKIAGALAAGLGLVEGGKYVTNLAGRIMFGQKITAFEESVLSAAKVAGGVAKRAPQIRPAASITRGGLRGLGIESQEEDFKEIPGTPSVRLRRKPQ